MVAFSNEFFQAKLGVSAMPTVPKVRREMLGLIPSGISGTIIELGSGWGGIACAAAKAHPECRVLGVEYSFFPFVVARIRKFFLPGLSNLSFSRKNFFDISFKGASVILCYLSNPLMARLKEKFSRELSGDAVVISSTFFIPGWEAETVKDISGVWNTRIFVYRPVGSASA